MLNKFLQSEELVNPCELTPWREVNYPTYSVSSTCYLNELIHVALFGRLGLKDDLYLISLASNQELLRINGVEGILSFKCITLACI